MNEIVPKDQLYRLTIHGLSAGAAMDLVARYSQTRNADVYRGFNPGTLEFDSYKWAAGFPLEFIFRLHATTDAATRSLEKQNTEELWGEMPFSALPDGQWEEIELT